MGTWEGHISPGVAFYSFGIVFCFQNSWAYFSGNRKNNRLDSRTNFGSFCARCSKLPVESVLKIIYGVGAASAELFYPPGTNKLMLKNEKNQFVHVMEWQHFCMYLSFAISGVVDLINIYLMKNKILSLEKAALAMAFYNTTLLLFFHQGHKAPLENQVHSLLRYATLGMCFVLTIEIWKPFDVVLIWAHTLLVMQMGSWLFHAAFILYPPSGEKWDGEDMHSLAILPVFFVWHIFLNVAVMGTIHILVFVIYKVQRSRTYSAIDDSAEMRCCTADDSESDEEFGKSGSTSKLFGDKGFNAYQTSLAT